MIGAIIGTILFYFTVGFFFCAMYALHKGNDIIFSHNNSDEENNILILIWTFWPIYVLYVTIKILIYYFKHLYIAIRDVSKKYIKFK